MGFPKWINRLFHRPTEPTPEEFNPPLGPQMTIEVSFRVSELLLDVDPPERRKALALQRARIDDDRARRAFLTLAGRRRVSIHSVDFVEFDSDNADVALAYFAIDYSGEEIDGTEPHHDTDGEA